MSLRGSECVAPCATEAVADQRTVCSSERHHRNAGPSRREDGRRTSTSARESPTSKPRVGEVRMRSAPTGESAVLAELVQRTNEFGSNTSAAATPP